VIVPVVPVPEVRDIVGKVLAQAGIPLEHAAIQLEVLLEAELRGIPLHGLLRLDRIIQRTANGVANPHTRGRFTWRLRGFLSVEGQMGLGPVVAKAALDVLQERSRETGVALAAVNNSNHIGMLGWYAEKVAASGQILIALSTSEALVHP